MFYTWIRNKEYRTVGALFLLFAVLFCGLIMLYTQFSYMQLHASLRARDDQIREAVAEAPNGLAQAIDEILAGGRSENRSAQGSVFDRHDVPLAADRMLHAARNRHVIGLALIGFIGVLIFFIGVSVPIGSIYERLLDFTLALEKMMTGRFDIALDDRGEGAVSVLAFQFNQLAHRMQNMLEQVTREKNALKNMIAYISHQFKTPVASVTLFIELMQQGTDEETRNDFLARSASELQRLEWLIQTLLDIARIESNAIAMKRNLQDIEGTAKKAAESLEGLALKKNIMFACHTNHPKMVLHDRDWVVEALKNILHNAIKFTKPGGRIDLWCESDDRGVCVHIRDTGEGMTISQTERIFDGFYTKEHTDTATGQKGCGLGLTLSKLVADRHGATLQVDSEKGKGSTFSFCFFNMKANLTKR